MPEHGPVAQVIGTDRLDEFGREVMQHLGAHRTASEVVGRVAPEVREEPGLVADVVDGPGELQPGCVGSDLRRVMREEFLARGIVEHQQAVEHDAAHALRRGQRHLDRDMRSRMEAVQIDDFEAERIEAAQHRIGVAVRNPHSRACPARTHGGARRARRSRAPANAMRRARRASSTEAAAANRGPRGLHGPHDDSGSVRRRSARRRDRSAVPG